MKTREMIFIAMFAALIAVGAFMRIPLPICPITLQFLFVMLAGVLLGGKNGALSVIVYALIGLAGVPVFTGGGGLSYVLQPTFGYIIGFAVGAYATGTIIYSGELTMKRLLIGTFTGLVIIFGVGVIYYWLITKLWLGNAISIKNLLVYCLFLPLPGDILLSILSAVIGKRLIPEMKHITASHKTA